MGHPIQIAVCGDSSPTTSHAEAARRAGRLIAEAGAILLTGGGGGVMEAAGRGALDAGGTVVAVLPGGRPEPPSELPPDVSGGTEVWIATGSGEARNVMLVRSAHTVVAVGGGFGTLSEIAIARRLDLPVFGYQTWQAAEPGSHRPLVDDCDSVEVAVARALEAARG